MSEFRRRLMMVGSGEEPIPYQQIEYLKTDGTAYIDTGISPASITPVMEARIYRANPSNAKYICGSDGSGNGRFSVAVSSAQRIELRLGNYTQYSGYKNNTWHTVKIDWANRTKYIDGVLKGTNTAAQMDGERSTHPILLFTCWSASNTIGTPYNGTRFSSFKLWDNTTLLLDMVPVRIDSVGYMYDKKWKRLFGNAAESGAFELGGDIEI